MKYNDLNKAINKKINKKNIFTKEDMIDYCKLLDTFNNLDLYCNDIEINSVVIDIENEKVLIDTIGIVSPLSIGGDLFE